jgi:SAM-dependent methyltransferase
MYRFPHERRDRIHTYYEEEYDSFERGNVTQRPPVEALENLVATSFRGSGWDASDRIDMVSSEIAAGRMLDYGCSWGYFLAQACARGFDGIGFEISLSRADFGRRHLGLRILTELHQLQQLPPMSIDVIYASHVLEHLDSPRDAFETFARLLRPGGILLIFVPNCGGDSANRLKLGWGPFSNEAHTLSFDADFFRLNLPIHGFTVMCRSEPYSGPSQLAGDELMVLARRVHE